MPDRSTLDETIPFSAEYGIVVRDIEVSLAFYRDIVGCQPYASVDLPGGLLLALRYGSALVKLQHRLDVPDVVSPRGDQLALGFRYLTFYVTDVDEIIGRCTEAGIEIVNPVGSFAPSVRFATVLDPDGNRVEFAEGTAWRPIDTEGTPP